MTGTLTAVKSEPRLVLEVAARMAQCHFTHACKLFGLRGQRLGGSKTVCDRDIREGGVWVDGSLSSGSESCIA